MDIIKRINIFLIIFAVLLVSFIIKDSIKSRKVNIAKKYENKFAEERAEASAKRDIRQIFSGGEGDEYKGKTVSTMEMAEVAVVPPPPANDTDSSFKVTRLFTREKRGNWMSPPSGFFAALTHNYLVYREQLEVNDQLKSALDDIHGNFVLDVIPFSLFSKFDRIFLMLFRTKDSYITYTGRPPWSIAMTNIDSQSVYIMENNDFKGNFVHELAHIYFDGFFKPTVTPLWLSEGFAVYMQVIAQSEADNKWIVGETASFKKGEYIDFQEFVTTDSLNAYPKDDVIMWYAQAYSVVRYLLKNKSRDEFYQFCKNLKDGMPVTKAMYRAYGMPFNTLNSLEYAWQADLQNNQRTN